MTNEEKYEYWLDIAQYDLKTAESMYKDGVKALFAELTIHYLNNRYPNFKQKLSASVDEVKAKTILDKTKETFTWLETLKP
jgi:HEPN domain-containing protein